MLYYTTNILQQALFCLATVFTNRYKIRVTMHSIVGKEERGLLKTLLEWRILLTTIENSTLFPE